MMPLVLPVAVHITAQASAVQCHKRPVPCWPYHLCAGMLEVLEMLHSPFTNWPYYTWFADESLVISKHSTYFNQ